MVGVKPSLSGGNSTAVLLFRSHLYVGTLAFRRSEVAQKGGRWSPKRIETTVGGVYPFGNRSRRPQTAKLPSPERAYCFATCVHHVKSAEERTDARQRRIANATRLHRKTAAEERTAARQRRIASQLVCTRERLLRKGLRRCCVNQQKRTEKSRLINQTAIFPQRAGKE